MRSTTPEEIDARFCTGSAFRALHEHMVRCSRHGGLRATAVFFCILRRRPFNQIVTYAGRFDASLERNGRRLLNVLKAVRSSPLLAHGMIMGVEMSGRDAVWLQLIEADRGVTFCSYVDAPDTIEIDVFSIE